MDPTVQLIEDLADRALGRAPLTGAIVADGVSPDFYRHVAAIDANALVDELPVPIGKNPFVKRLMIKLSGFFLVRQRAVNQATLGAMNELVHAVDQLRAEIDHERRRSVAAIAAVEPRLMTAAQQQRAHFEQLAQRLTQLERAQTDMSRAVDELRGHVEHELAMSVVRHEAVDGSLTSLRDALTVVDAAAAETGGARAELLAELAGRVDDLRADAALERTRRHVLERRVGILGAAGSTVPKGQATDDDLQTGTVDEPSFSFDLTELYERFEASFRPSDADLFGRFAEYLDDLAPLAGGTKPVLDIGTGRGELLEVLTAAGIPCQGIDLNPHAVALAAAKGLDVELIGGKEHLAATADESLGAVVALHVVEHLEPAALLAMVDEVARVLAPGGIIILETPNPTNLAVGAASFYHDPTHQRPVTPDYLAFLLHDRGFVHVETRFLHPSPEFELELPAMPEPGMRSLEMLLRDVRWALKGPMDYAVVARRPEGR